MVVVLEPENGNYRKFSGGGPPELPNFWHKLTGF